MSGFKIVLKYGDRASTRGVALLYRQQHLALEPTDLAMTRGVVRSHAYPAEPRGRKAMADTWHIPSTKPSVSKEANEEVFRPHWTSLAQER